MNNLLKVEINKMQTKIEPLQNTEMLLITGGIYLSGGTDVAMCGPIGGTFCPCKCAQNALNKGDTEQKVSF